MNRRFFLILILTLVPAALSAATATVSIDYNSDINYFSPAAAFSMNTGQWQGFAKVKNNAWQFQHAGIRCLRFPGGSNSNEYHWNGDGSYDPENIWHVTGSPNPTTFKTGFMNLSLYRGSTSAGYGKKAFVTDTSLSTSWMSYPGETTPQWIYLSVQTGSYQAVAVNRVVIEWGTPYAAQYKVQYSNANYPGGLDVWAYNDTAWADTSLGIIAGAGGQADLSFSQVSAKYIRVLCLVPSSGSQYEIKDIKVYLNTTQVSVNSDDPKAQTKSVSSSMAYGDAPDYYDNMDFEQFMSVCKSMTPAAEPLITVNFFTGVTQEAKDWVEYANNHKGYNIKYWEVGNECAGNWESGGPVGPEFYAKRFIAFWDAMTAADPGIIVMPQFNSATDPCNITCTANNPGASDYYIESFLKYLQAQGRSGIIKAISIHRYPTWQPASEAVVLANTGIWDAELAPLNGWINTYCGGPSNTTIWLTEYNDGIDSAFTNRFYNSLFVSSYLLNYIKNGGDYGFFFADFGTPGPGQQAPGIFSDFGAMEGGGLSGPLINFRYQPRSSYWALYMLSNRFSAADALGNTLVTATSSLSSLKVFANKRGDRKLSLILVNTGNSTAVDASISLAGFTPLGSADVCAYSPQQYTWVEDQYDSHADPDIQPPDSSLGGVSASFAVNVPAYNIKVITMYDSSQATLTPSSTPTQLPTPTITLTPLPNGGSMLDDCEDGDLNDLWGGKWSIYGDAVSSYPAALSAMTCDGNGAIAGSVCYMKTTGTVLDETWGFGVNIPFSASWIGVDISQYDGLAFYYKGAGTSVRIGFPQTDMSDSNYGVEFNSNTYWTYYEMPFSALTHSPWGNPGGTWTALNVQTAQFQPDGGYGATGGYREINIDNIFLYKFTPTATATPSYSLENDLTHVKAQPSLCNYKEGCSAILFTGLTEHTILKVYTLDGKLIYKTERGTPDGTLSWNIDPAKRSKKIAPGTYLYIVMNEKKDIARGKVSIVR